MMFRALADTDVADRRRHQNSFGAFERTQHDLDRELGTILPPPSELDPGADLLCQCILCGPKTIRDQPFRKALWNNVGYFLSKEIGAAISTMLLRVPADANVPFCRRRDHSFGTFQPGQADLNRKLSAILAPCDEVDAGT